MFNIKEIQSITDFQRNSKDQIHLLKTTGRPMILTVNGKAEIIVQDAEAYQELLNQVDRAQAIASVHLGLEQMDKKLGRSADEVFKEIRRKHNIPS